MSFLRRREHRRGKVATAATTVAVLGAFQVLAIIGAGSASAVTGCTYNPATQTVTITVDVPAAAGVTVEDADDLDPESPSGAILFDADGDFDFDEGAAVTTQCGSATNSNTTSIVVLGSPGADEWFYIANGGFVGIGGGAAFSSSITWAIDMGSNTVGGYDEVDFYLTAGDDELTLTDTTFDMNGGTGTLLGVEASFVRAHEGDDVVDASATANLFTDLNLGTDDDWAALGSGAGPSAFGWWDEGYGGDGVDQISYGHRTTCTVIDVTAGEAGMDFNCDGDLADATDEVDLIGAFEIFETGSANDNLYGSGAGGETFIPGDGDDYVDAGGGPDFIDWSSSSAAMEIDVPNGEATGQGTDTWENGVVSFIGSNFDDLMLVDGDAPSCCADGDVDEFYGLDGVDTVNASAATAGVWINLDILDPSGADDLEDIIGSAFDDDLHGNDLRNRIEAGAGNDYLDGQPGNDTFLGGPGNDTYFGDSGADTVDFGDATGAGIDADMSLGFATAKAGGDSGDDSFDDLIEIIKGTPSNDTITGGGGLVTINFIMTGRAGNDRLTGSGSNDTLKGGADNDKLRGLEGGDTLVGGKGKKDKGWGGPGVDFCKGVEKEKGCEA